MNGLSNLLFLDCLSGYLLLGQELRENTGEFSSSWNFGPSSNDNQTVEAVLERLKSHWPEMNWTCPNPSGNEPHESSLLSLDATKARELLNWRPVWSLDDAISKTADWYRTYQQTGEVKSLNQLRAYIENAHERKVVWAQ